MSKARLLNASAFALFAILSAGIAVLASAQAQQQGPIKIGFLIPMTGPLASSGADMSNGYKLFWSQANNTAGGRKVEVITG